MHVCTHARVCAYSPSCARLGDDDIDRRAIFSLPPTRPHATVLFIIFRPPTGRDAAPSRRFAGHTRLRTGRDHVIVGRGRNLPPPEKNPRVSRSLEV